MIDKYKLLAQAEVLEWYKGRVRDAMQEIQNLGHRKNSQITQLAEDWESKSKIKYQHLLLEMSQTQFTAENLCEELISELGREAEKLRDLARDLERQEKGHEQN